MLKLIFLLVLVLSIRCSTSPPKNEVSAIQEGTDTLLKSKDTSLVIEYSAERDTSNLEELYETKREAILNTSDDFYEVSISNKQYEAVSDVTWYFDGDFSPRYFSMDWAAEGYEGSTELIIEDGRVVCSTSQEYNTTSKWCSDTGGTSTTWEEDPDEPVIELLPPEYGSKLNNELDEFMDVLTRILNENEVTSENESTITITKEVEVNYGSGFTEALEVTLPRKLYDYLKEN